MARSRSEGTKKTDVSLGRYSCWSFYRPGTSSRPTRSQGDPVPFCRFSTPIRFLITPFTSETMSWPKKHECFVKWSSSQSSIHVYHKNTPSRLKQTSPAVTACWKFHKTLHCFLFFTLRKYHLFSRPTLKGTPKKILQLGDVPILSLLSVRAAIGYTLASRQLQRDWRTRTRDESGITHFGSIRRQSHLFIRL